MIEDIEEKIKSFNMVIFITRSVGEVVKLSKIVDEDEVVDVLYIPQLDVSIEGQNVGESASGLFYRRFVFRIMEEEEFLFPSIQTAFISGGWSMYQGEY